MKKLCCNIPLVNICDKSIFFFVNLLSVQLQFVLIVSYIICRRVIYNCIIHVYIWYVLVCQIILVDGEILIILIDHPCLETNCSCKVFDWESCLGHISNICDSIGKSLWKCPLLEWKFEEHTAQYKTYQLIEEYIIIYWSINKMYNLLSI